MTFPNDMNNARVVDMDMGVKIGFINYFLEYFSFWYCQEKLLSVKLTENCFVKGNLNDEWGLRRTEEIMV